MSDITKRIAELSPQKRKMLEEKLGAKGINHAKYTAGLASSIYRAIKPAAESPYYPVSASQRRMYILNQFAGIGIAYNIPSLTLIEGELNYQRFEKSIRELISRHEALRTSFQLIDGAPMQVIHKELPFSIDYLEFTEAEINAQIHDLIQAFDLEKAPLLRIALIKLEKTKHLLLFDMHHIITDGISMNILLRDFVYLYDGKVLPELKFQYKDFSTWQHELMLSDTIKRQEEYWVNQFSNGIPTLNMPTDFPRPQWQSFEGDYLKFGFDPKLTAALKELALRQNGTLYMVLLAGYYILLSKYTGQEDIVIGSAIADRPHPDLENIVGVFINSLALRNYPEERKSVLQFLEEVRFNTLHSIVNQDYPFERLVEKINVKRDTSRNPLYEVMFTFQNINTDVELPGLRFSSYPLAHRITHIDLNIIASSQGDNLVFNLEYCTKLFTKETMKRLTGHFTSIFQQIAANPAILLAEIEILSPAEKKELLNGFKQNETGPGMNPNETEKENGKELDVEFGF